MVNDGEKPVHRKRKSRRRWFRYSLRTLLGLTLVVAVLLGVYRHFAVAHRERQEFIAAAAKLGAHLKIRPWNSSESRDWNDALQFGLWDQIEEFDLSMMDFTSGNEPHPDLLIKIYRYISSDSWIDPIEAKRAPIEFPEVIEFLGVPEEVTEEMRETRLACLQRLRYLPGLKRLSLLGFHNAEAIYLRGLKHLEHLDLSYAEISNTGLVHLRGLAELETLDLDWTQVSDDGIATLNELTSLRRLNLEFTKVAHAYFKGLRRLEYLSLAGAPVTSIQFDNSDNLRTLNLSHTNLPDTALRGLSKLKKLLRLGLHRTRVHGEGMQFLSRLPCLEALSLDSRAINEQSLKHLRKIKSLKDLHVYFVATDDAKAVNALKNLIRGALPLSVTIHDCGSGPIHGFDGSGSF